MPASPEKMEKKGFGALSECGWVRSIAVVSFNVGSGHTIEHVVPVNSLDEEDCGRIKMSAMPDCNTTQIGDCFYCFRIRKSFGLPLFSASLLEQTFEYCYALFRQEPNPACARGYFQKSVVIVSRYPYVSIFERLVKVIGPLYFEHGVAVLEAVLAHIWEWPGPGPNLDLSLPFLGETIFFRVPNLDLPAQVAAKLECKCGPVCTNVRGGHTYETEVEQLELQLQETSSQHIGGIDSRSPVQFEDDDNTKWGAVTIKNVEETAVRIANIEGSESLSGRAEHAAANMSGLETSELGRSVSDISEGTTPLSAIRRKLSGCSTASYVSENNNLPRRLSSRLLMHPSPGGNNTQMQGVSAFPAPLTALAGGGGMAEGCYFRSDSMWSTKSFNEHGRSSSSSSSSDSEEGQEEIIDIDEQAVDNSERQEDAALHSTNNLELENANAAPHVNIDDIEKNGLDDRIENDIERESSAGANEDEAGNVAPIYVDNVGVSSEAQARSPAGESTEDGFARVLSLSPGGTTRSGQKRRPRTPPRRPLSSKFSNSDITLANNNAGVEPILKMVPEGRSPFAEMLLGEEALSRSKQGLFQSIGLYSVFGRRLVEHLWFLWELTLTSSPIIVVGPDVGSSSAVILASVSLCSPLYYGGDFRPHFTTFDPDYKDIAAEHQRLRKEIDSTATVGATFMGGTTGESEPGTEFPSLLLGVINPIFLKTLDRWPNAIILPGAAGRQPTDWKRFKRMIGGNKHRHKHSTSQAGSHKMLRIIQNTASLDTIVNEDVNSDEPLFISRRTPIMTADRTVLAKLLDPHSHTSTTSGGEKHNNTNFNSTGSGSGPGCGTAHRRAVRDSIRAINDVVLRRHFTALTRAFLEPFNVYFRPEIRVETSPSKSKMNTHDTNMHIGNNVSAHVNMVSDQNSSINDVHVQKPINIVNRSPSPPGRRDTTKEVTIGIGRLGSVPLHEQMAHVLGKEGRESNTGNSGENGARKGVSNAASVYDDVEGYLKWFDEETFLTTLEPPSAFRNIRWRELYRRFVRSPGFRPWFTTQRNACVKDLRGAHRAMCMQTPADAIVRSCMPTGSDHMRRAELVHLLVRVQAAADREQEKILAGCGDEPLFDHINGHLSAVNEALAQSTPSHIYTSHTHTNTHPVTSNSSTEQEVR